MLDQEQITDKLILISEEIEYYFGEENSRFFGIKPEYNLDKGISPKLTYLIYKSFEIVVNISDIEKGGTINYLVNLGSLYSLNFLVPYKISQRISLNDSSEDIRRSLEVLDEYLIWRMTDAQKKTFGIPLDKEVLKED